MVFWEHLLPNCLPRVVFVHYFIYILIAFVVINMSSEAEKLAAVKKVPPWPTNRYNSFILLLFIFVLVVLAICKDISAICLVCNYVIKYQYVFNIVNVMFMIFSVLS